MIRMIGIDVDGTLVGSSGLVPAEVWRAAQRARAAGIHLALCSGRPAFGVALEFARRLDPSGWHVFQNGASVVDLNSGQSCSVSLPEPAVRSLITQARRTGELLELYTHHAYAYESTSLWAQQHAAILGVPYEPRPFDSLTGPIVRAQWLLSSEGARTVLDARYEDLEISPSGSPLMPQTTFIAITRAGVNKGSALRAVAASYAVQLHDVMYVGDSDNDVAALRIVGHPVAMADGSPAARAAARTIVPSADDAGLIAALEQAIDAN